jgi:hypothetical protein
MLTRSLKALVAVPLFFSVACGASGTTDELAGETSADDAVDGKADAAVDGAYTYFEVWVDQRKCASPVCGGFFVHRLNRTTTVCHDGATKTDCYIPALDWTEAHLSDAQQSKLVEAANQDATSDGVRAIVRGRFASKTYQGHGNMGRFVVTEAWVAETASVSDGVFARVKDNGVKCITAPCPSLVEKGLNTSRFANIAGIDWSFAGLTSHEVEGFTEDLFTPSGVIIAGDRYTVTENGHHAKGRTATAAYHRLSDASAACYVGGCSGQVCSDQEGVITTCEWHPEYACYQTATCERQTDGNCGWTDTAELDACLGGN